MSLLPRLALTPGEPAGIGPDLCLDLARSAYPAQLVILADPEVLAERAERLGQAVTLIPFDPEAPPQPQRPGTLQVLPVPLARPCTPGRPDPANAAAVLRALEIACAGCCAGRFQALVTGPVHKAVINEAGFPFTGHTEFLAQRCGGTPVMLLATDGLRVALVTTHLPLRQVPDAITPARLTQVIRILHGDLRRRFGIPNPRILVFGLNPHAGEDGHLGREEIEIIQPVLEALRAEGLMLIGPIPADTAFLPHRRAQADALLALYHDQGLAALKAQGFGRTVNITLGLPILRTSVDHGTALDLAGTGKADPGSLRVALDRAREMVAAENA